MGKGGSISQNENKNKPLKEVLGFYLQIIQIGLCLRI